MFVIIPYMMYKKSYTAHSVQPCYFEVHNSVRIIKMVHAFCMVHVYSIICLVHAFIVLYGTCDNGRHTGLCSQL